MASIASSFSRGKVGSKMIPFILLLDIYWSSYVRFCALERIRFALMMADPNLATKASACKLLGILIRMLSSWLGRVYFGRS